MHFVPHERDQSKKEASRLVTGTLLNAPVLAGEMFVFGTVFAHDIVVDVGLWIRAPAC